MKFNTATRWIIIALTLAATVFYASYEKSVIERALRHPDVPILKAMPSVTFQTLDKESISTADIIGNLYKGVYVHFWGTWCAPCEAEFPSLIEFTQKMSNEETLFLLVAVNDEEMKIRKFLKEKVKGALGKNVKVILDDGKSLPEFGTVKVPETYLFNGSGVTLKKYIGSFEWMDEARVNEFKKLTN